MRPRFDPQQCPVLAIDDHLPAVPRDRLAAPALRDRFERAPAWEPERVADRQTPPRAPVHASVLMPLVLRGDGITVLLTQRSERLSDHPGQISFPGGRAEAGDLTPVATALREAEEEVGLARDFVQVLGTLPHYTTVTGYVVTPVVALVQPGFSLRVDASEVAEVFEVPLAYLMSPAHHRWHAVGEGEEAREFLSMPWTSQAADGTPKSYFIWGATAAMLRNFYRFLAA
ncbi:MAG: CoA pyrophosphatase [Burkholderiaceae bacterium]|nr:CoA pyrophosphatase [Burkholderiaceae bacterium]